MAIIEDKFREWLGNEWPDGNTRWHQDDLESAYAAGWLAAQQQQQDPKPAVDGR